MEAQIKRHEPLYLKHRPQALEQLVGQTAVTRTLTNAINNDRIAHAYLFTGPRGTGKTSSARILAKSLNCKAVDKATVTPCQECASCIEIAKGTSPAVFEIDAASNNSVDDARTLIERAPLVAPGGRYKIYIIDECHMLTKEAFNALLKCIEEPPPNVVFVLATTEEHKVLPTIISRCQRLMFRLVTQDDLLPHLRAVATKENIEITDRALDFVARRSGGGLRDALGLLDQASLLASPGQPVDITDLLSLLGALQEDMLLGMSESVLHRRGQELLSSAAKLLQDGREPAVIVQELARHFLNLAKASYLADHAQRDEVASQLIIGSPNYLTGLYEQATQFERSELTQLVEALDRLESTCRRTTQPAMHLEVGLLSLCHRQDMLIVRELSDRVTRLEQSLSGGIAPHVVHPAQGAERGLPVRTPAAMGEPAPSPAAAPAAPVAQMQRAQQEPTISRQAELRNADEGVRTPSLPQSAAQAPSPVSPAATAIKAAPSPVSAAPTATAPAPTAAVQAPSPVSPAATATKAAAAAEENESVSADEVDRIWGDTLEELQRRHIPTYSIASMHAVPLSLNDRELVLGTKEAFIKTLEMKVEHIKNACVAVSGKQLGVRIKAISMDAPAAKAAAPKPRERESVPQQPVAAAAPSHGAPGPDADEEYEPAEPYGDNSREQPTSQTEQASSNSPASMQGQTAIDRAHERAAAAGPVATTQRGNDSTVIKEAYKLFEGPGSRQIGDKK